jgi:hypothetical protein
MPSVDYQRERAEVEAVLASGIFERSPSLAHIFVYICQKYFEGSADQLKEYNIGVDALGRPIDFDQKRDSIVRVQIHRLRERLEDYYRRDGAGHPVKIEIPQGQYKPRFVVVECEPAEKSVAMEPVAPLDPLERIETPAEPAPRRRWRKQAMLAAGIAAAALAGAYWYESGSPRRAAPVLTPDPAPGAAVRIAAGSEADFLDGFGRNWQSDRFFEGGTVVRLSGRPITGTREDRLYQNRRQGTFSYHIPLAPGVYELRLHFAETHFGEQGAAGLGGESSRAFKIGVNGKTVVTRLDVMGEAGGNTAQAKVFKDVSPGEDGKLHITFGSIVSVPFLNAIEVTPGVAGQLRPIRYVARPQAYVDAAGRRWEPDRIAEGGQLVSRSGAVEGGDPELFQGERFGNLAYAIPVAGKSTYTVRLWMAEQWLGPEMPGAGGEGTRLFDILCNGVALAREVDVFRRAGGSNRVVEMSFPHIKPTPQGKIELRLLPVRNFAIFNAMEIVEETN